MLSDLNQTALTRRSPAWGRLAAYLQKRQFWLYRNTDAAYFGEGESFFRDLVEHLRQAETYIFMEYYILAEGTVWDEIFAVLKERAAAGVEIHLIIDDFGTLTRLSDGTLQAIKDAGIEVEIFNPVHRYINRLYFNYRDHRKITVIDGYVAYAGGINIGDEYANRIERFGYWKDTGVKLTGRAVQNFTMMFLEMWNVMGQADTDYEKYLKASQEGAEDGNVQKASGYVQPYADSPLDGEPVGENVYLNLIKTAKKRLYVATPYLIISDEMTRELGLAAKRGVDVRVFTPGIPDKKIIYGVTRSYYSGLVRQGVRVYEYTPGFLHAKQMLCDGDTATVGTINMDYRSLYHHFENGVWMHGCDAIRDIEADFDKLLQNSEEVTDKYRDGRKNMAVRGWQCIMRLIAPLL